MKDGLIAADGSPESLYNKPNSAFTASFTGDGTLLDASLFFENQTGSIFFRPESVIISDEPVNIFFAVPTEDKIATLEITTDAPEGSLIEDYNYYRRKLSVLPLSSGKGISV